MLDSEYYSLVLSILLSNDPMELQDVLRRCPSASVASRIRSIDTNCGGQNEKCYHGRVTQILIDAGLNPNYVNEDGESLLYQSLSNMHLYSALLLVGAGASVKELTDKKSTPLHFAAAYCDLDLVRAMLKAGANVNHRDRDGWSPLDTMMCIPHPSAEPKAMSAMFNLLRDAGAELSKKICFINPRVPSDVICEIVPENTPVWFAANNEAELLEAELQKGLKPNTKTQNGMTLLHWACAGDAPECVQLLLDAGAKKEAGSPEPIFFCKSSACLKLLINAGVNVNVNWDGEYPLDYAIITESPACVKTLVRAGASVTEKERGPGGGSPLKALLLKRPVPYDTLMALLETAGDRVLDEPICNMPPLYCAVRYSTVDAVRAIINCGIEKDYKVQHTPLQLAHMIIKSPKVFEMEQGFPQDNDDVIRIKATIKYLETLPRYKKQ